MLKVLKRLLKHHRPVEAAASTPVEDHRGQSRLGINMMARLDMAGERSLTCLVSDVSRDGVRLTLPATAVPQSRARLHLSFNGFQMSKPVHIVWSRAENTRVVAGVRFEAEPGCPMMESFERFIRWKLTA